MFPGRLKPRVGERPFIRPDGLIVDWIMNEGGGSTIQDYSGNGNTGTLVGDTHFVPGRIGSALTLDGADDYIDKTDPSFAGDLKGAVAFWHLRRNTGESSFFSFSLPSSGAVDEIRLVFDSATDVDKFTWVVRLNSSTVTVLVSDSTFDLSPFTHIVFQANGTSRTELYVNGVSAPLTATTGSDLGQWFGDAVTDADTFTVGGIQRSGGLLSDVDGLFDSVQVYNRDLTPGEVQQLYIDSFWYFRRDPIELWAAATAGASTVPVLDEGMLVGGLMPMAGGLA